MADLSIPELKVSKALDELYTAVQQKKISPETYDTIWRVLYFYGPPIGAAEQENAELREVIEFAWESWWDAASEAQKEGAEQLVLPGVLEEISETPAAGSKRQ